MANPSYEVTRHGSEGHGCYSCKLFSVCSLRRQLHDVVKRHLFMLDVDDILPKYPMIRTIAAEACIYWDPVDGKEAPDGGC